jgi:hypothetical protein
MCYNCSKKRSVDKVNVELQKKNITLEYKKDKTLPRLSMQSTIKEGEKYRCADEKCGNVLTAGKKCDDNYYFYCYHCYIKNLKDDYKSKPKQIYDDEFLDD